MRNYLTSDSLSVSEKWKIEESAREMIGVEIKRKRLLLARTLKEISMDLCSASYLCKIEKNQIQANRWVLCEICRRVDISPEHLDLMFELFDIIQMSITDYVYGDIDSIDQQVKKGRGLENYRYRILHFMYHIAKNEMNDALRIFDELCPLLTDMMDYDKTVFLVFAGILRYKERSYQEAIDLLAGLQEAVMSEDLKYLRTRYLFLSSLMLSSHDTIYHYDSCVSLLIKNGRYELIEEIHYAACIYALREKAYYFLDKIQILLKNPIHINSVEFLRAYLDADMEAIRKLENEEMNDFCTMLAGITKGEDGKLECMMHLGTSMDDFDYSSNILKCLAEKNQDARLAFIQRILPYYETVNDAFTKRYLMKEFTRLSLNKNHYKSTCEALYSYFWKS